MLKSAKTGYLSLSIEAAVLSLMAVGTVFVFSAGANLSTDYNLQHFYSFTTLKQIIFFPLAVIVMYLAAHVDYHRFALAGRSAFKSFSPYLLILSITLLILVLIPGIGVEKNYSRRWLAVHLGPAAISFQPSELAKWALVFFLAAFVDRFADTIKLYRKRFVPACLIAGVTVGLIVTQDFGTAAFIAMLTFAMLLIGRACWWHFLTPLPALAAGFCYVLFSSPHRINRLKAFFFPDMTDNPATYHATQSLIAISTGGIWGKGLGRGISKYGHLPEDTTDFIFAIISEEFGFVGALFVIAVFIALAVLGILVVRRCKDHFGRVLAAGIVFTITTQAAINIGVVTAVLPTKGIPLPFISAGGTSMLLTAAAVGVLLNIARQADEPANTIALPQQAPGSVEVSAAAEPADAELMEGSLV